MTTEVKKRVVSGMRPTGRLHIGHYFGALQNWVRLQNAVSQETPASVPEYECFYFIADWHALTSDYADTSAVAQNVTEIATDYLAVGLDPGKSVIFLQSLVPEHAELHLLLSMVTPLGWLERVPTYKEALENVKDKDLHTYGFLGYPVLQTADIVIYSKEGVPLVVPVGEDQVSHVELSREIVRKFNLHNLMLDAEALMRPENDGATFVIRRSFDPQGDRFQIGAASAHEIPELQSKIRRRVAEVGLNNYVEQLDYFDQFTERHGALRQFLKPDLLSRPEVMLTTTPRIPGLDGRKMSKSYGNTITLSESDAEIRAKTKVMVTDPARKRRTDPGNPDVCPVYDWHKLFSAEEPGRLEWVRTGCTTAGIGCIECKAAMADNLIKWIAPVRERRVEYEKNPERVREIIEDGSRRARVEAVKTMERVREAVLGWKKRREVK